MTALNATTTESRALALLGDSIDPETVASTLGVSSSRISQFLADEEFAKQVVILKFEKLTAHNERDSAYDNLEDALIVKLKKSLPFLIKPEIILKALQTINAAKRRGQAAPTQVVNQQTIVSLTLPTKIIQQFTTNIHNQVTATTDRSLETMQSGQLLKQIEDKSALANEGRTN